MLADEDFFFSGEPGVRGVLDPAFFDPLLLFDVVLPSFFNVSGDGVFYCSTFLTSGFAGDAGGAKLVYSNFGLYMFSVSWSLNEILMTSLSFFIYNFMPNYMILRVLTIVSMILVVFSTSILKGVSLINCF